jgi:hypothetical protein
MFLPDNFDTDFSFEKSDYYTTTARDCVFRFERLPCSIIRQILSAVIGRRRMRTPVAS